MRSVNKPLLYISFFLYFSLLVWIVIFKCNLYIPVSESMIIMPTKPLIERISLSLPTIERIKNMMRDIDFWRNIIIFIPLGIYLPLISRRVRLLSGTLIAFLISLSFEISQVFTCIGGFTLEDLFSNTVGFLIGYIIFKVAMNRLPEGVINIINIAIIVIATPIFLYATYNTAVNWEIYTLEYYHEYYHK